MLKIDKLEALEDVWVKDKKQMAKQDIILHLRITVENSPTFEPNSTLKTDKESYRLKPWEFASDFY
jgi:hypothetical protein